MLWHFNFFSHLHTNYYTFLVMHVSMCTPVYTVDMDECALGSDCDENANCQNTDGSYTCTCLYPFTGDGKSCTGKQQDFYMP